MSTPHQSTSELEAWASAVAAELQIDAVGMWQVVGGARRSFPVSESRQAEAIAMAVSSLLAAGAQPVFGSHVTKGWHVAAEFQGHSAQNRILAYLQNLNREPNIGDLWFALPEFISN